MKASYAHGASNRPLLGGTIGDFLDEAAEKFAGNEALVSMFENRRFTYAQFRDEVDRAARALLALGLKKGDRVGIWSTNSVAWVLAQFATAKIGAILVTINPAYRLHELEFALRQSECNVLISGERFKDADYAAMLRQLIPELAGDDGHHDLRSEKFPHLRRVVLVSETFLARPAERPSTRPSGTLSPIGGEGWGEGAVHGEGHSTADAATHRHDRLPSSPLPSPPPAGGEGEEFRGPNLFAAPSGGAGDRRTGEGLLSWNELLTLAAHVAPDALAERQASLDCDDVINIQYTSGTTGFPKGAMLTHHNILNNGYWVGDRMGLTHLDRLCIPVPFYHCFGMVLGNLTCVAHGATMVLPAPHFSPLHTLQTVARERCTALHGVPSMFIAELNHPQFREFDLSSLRTGIMAGAPCPVEVMKRVMTEMHCAQITIACGMTEASPVCNMTAVDDPLDVRVGTVGKVMPHQEQKVIDPATGHIVARGQPGEICFRGHHVMRGYYNNPEGTARALDAAGWLHSGDLAVMDEHGFVKITGRLKDMICRGGEKIFPREVEEFLFTHPEIAEACVIGVPDAYYGEEVMAWVKCRDGALLTIDLIRSFCRGRIMDYKIPRYVKFVTEFPVTVTGKVQKFRMREISTEELGLTAKAEDGARSAESKSGSTQDS